MVCAQAIGPSMLSNGGSYDEERNTGSHNLCRSGLDGIECRGRTWLPVLLRFLSASLLVPQPLRRTRIPWVPSLRIPRLWASRLWTPRLRSPWIWTSRIPRYRRPYARVLVPLRALERVAAVRVSGAFGKWAEATPRTRSRSSSGFFMRGERSVRTYYESARSRYSRSSFSSRWKPPERIGKRHQVLGSRFSSSR